MPSQGMRAAVLLALVSGACSFQAGLRAPLGAAQELTTALRRHFSRPAGRYSLVMQQQTQERDNVKVVISGDKDEALPQAAAAPAGLPSYGDFARNFPFANNIAIATTKTAAADLMAQVVISQTPVSDIDWARNLLFCAFGAIYLGGFQYLYQVQVFKKLFDVDKFTSQPWAAKLRDGPGLRALAAQTALDLTVLTLIYLPTFYIFKAGVFTGSLDPAVWASTGIENYQANFAKDELDLVLVWLPADLVCFSVPLYLRLPVRHIVSFVWTAYLSFARGGH